MAEQPGFLASLGISPVDERDAVQAQRDALATQQQQRMQALGAQAGRGVAGLLGGAIGKARGQGFGASAKKAHESATDRDVAQQTGISIDQLRGRRKIRQLSADNKGDPSFASRRKFLSEIITIANQSGDTELVGNALRQLQSVREEEEAFKQLQAKTITEETKAEGSDVTDAIYNGKPVTGVLSEDTEGRKGLTMNIGGQQVFKPWGDGLHQEESMLAVRTAGGAKRTDAELISSYLGKKKFNEVSNAVMAEKDLLNKYDGVLDLVSQAIGDDRAGELVGQAGKLTAWIDNKVETFRNVLNTFAPGDVFKKDSDLQRRWRGHANRPNAEIWSQVELPEWARDNSKNAQNYRARIIELAYVVARSAEPSNRGLSDNDIERALDRLGVESADPEVMMRRAYEIIIDGTTRIDDTIAQHYGGRHKRRDGSIIADEEIDIIFGGQALSRYRSGVQKLYAKYGVTPGSGGRVVIPGTSVNPGDDTANLAPAEAPLPTYTDADVDQLLIDLE